MLTICPNCATSYGVEMASVRLPKGWACQVRCNRCHCVWKAELSVADKLIVAADAVAPVQRAMAAAQALVGDVTWSPPLQGAPRLAFDRIAAGLAGVRTVQVGLPDASGYAAARVAWRSAMSSLFARYEAGRARNGWRLSLSLAHLLIVALLVADATIIGLRAQVTWLMPQTASFYSAFGLPVDLYALRFDNVAAVAERRDAKTVLVVNGKISNSRTRTETVRACALPSATRAIRKFFRGRPRQRATTWAPAKPSNFAANLPCRRPTRAMSSYASITTT